MTPIFSGLGTASVRGFGRIFKGPGQFLWDTEVLLSTPGAGNWTKPENITQVQIECWGGGGSGGGATASNSAGGGAAGGQYARKIVTYASAQQSIAYSVAASVTGTTGAGSIGNDTTWNTNVVVAKGGAAGGAFNTQTGIALGGEGSIIAGIGDIVYAGGTASTGSFSTGVFGANDEATGGAGGGGAGSSGNGSLFGTSPTPDFGGSGGGTVVAISSGLPGNPGFNYGGGGGGAAKISGANRSGGAGAQGLIRVRYNSGALIPEYWWRADSGLSTSAWNAVNGGLNFTLFNVTSATAATGLFLNGFSSYGLTQNISTNIEAKHIFVRTDSISTTPNTTHAILGGTQSTIHEWSFNPSTLENNWFIVENLSTGLTWAAELGQIGSSITWTDLTNYTAPRYFLNTDTTGTDMNVYVGGFNNRLLWESGFGIYVGRRGEDAFVSGYIKEIAIFTTPLTDAAAKTFRAAMAARWP